VQRHRAKNRHPDQGGFRSVVVEALDTFGGIDIVYSTILAVSSGGTQGMTTHR
jgi:hypothetical protein